MLVELTYKLIQPAFESVAGVAEGVLHGDGLRVVVQILELNDFVLVLNAEVEVVDVGKFFGGFVFLIEVTGVTASFNFHPNFIVKIFLIHLHLYGSIIRV